MKTTAKPGVRQTNSHTESPKELLLADLNSAFRLTAAERNELTSLFTERKIKRRGLILQYGDVCRHFTFVASGCFKMYTVDNSDKEYNLEFAAEKEWIMDLSSFYSETEGSVYIEALEPSTILQIKHDDVIHLYSTYPKLNSAFRIIIEHKYIALQNRVLQNISATAEERYLYFIKQFPGLTNRLPSTQIASYLGITSEFLSKIRHDLSGKSKKLKKS